MHQMQVHHKANAVSSPAQKPRHIKQMQEMHQMHPNLHYPNKPVAVMQELRGDLPSESSSRIQTVCG
jgi:hypothetical protein